MGLMNEIFSFFGLSKRETRILIIGLDNSGKTTILNNLKSAGSQSTQVSYCFHIFFNLEFNLCSLPHPLYVVDGSHGFLTRNSQADLDFTTTALLGYL